MRNSVMTPQDGKSFFANGKKQRRNVSLLSSPKNKMIYRTNQIMDCSERPLKKVLSDGGGESMARTADTTFFNQRPYKILKGSKLLMHS